MTFRPALAIGLISASLWLGACAHAAPSVDFFRAVNIDRAPMVVDLVKAGLDPNVRSEQGHYALYLALRDGSPNVFNALLAMPGINVNATNDVGETPLMMAALRQNIGAMNALIKQGASINKTGWTPLHYAGTGGSAEAVQLLLAQKADIEAKSPNGSTPLMMAARYGSDESTLALLKAGASPVARNEQGLTAADFARSVGRDSLAAQLDRAAKASANPK